MKLTLINHASVLFEDEIFLLTDPWYSGQVFNDSWALEYETSDKDIQYVVNNTTHLYISHEHPDHLHFPTLKYLVTKFKNKVTVLIQDLPRKEILYALKKIGFETIIEVKHRQKIKLSNNINFYIYSVFPVDSASAILIKNQKTILNCNDTELSNYDLKKIKNDLGNINIILNQFSFATYNGNVDVESETLLQRKQMIDSFIKEHKYFDAEFSIPFASFSYFCKPDNKYLNKHKTKLIELKNALNKNLLKSKFLMPGEQIDIYNMENFDEKGFDIFEKKKIFRIFNDETKISYEEIKKSFHSCYDNLNRKFPKLIIKFIGDFIVYCSDIDKYIIVNFKSNQCNTSTIKNLIPDLIMKSQPFNYALSNSWGLNSLTIGGRLILKNKEKKFLLFRILMALNNSNISLKLNTKSISSFIFIIKNFSRIFFQAFAQIENIFLHPQEYSNLNYDKNQHKD